MIVEPSSSPLGNRGLSRNRRACAPLDEGVSSRSMISELERVALTVNLPELGLTAGGVGAVAHVFKGGQRFWVEFTTFDGSAVRVTKVSAAQIRPLSRNEISIRDILFSKANGEGKTIN